MRSFSGNQKKQRRIRFSRAAAVGTVALLFQCGPGGMATSWGVDCLFEDSPSRNYCVDNLADDLPTDNSWTLRKAVNDANNLSSDTSTAVVKFKPTLFLEPAPTPTPSSTQTPEPQPSTVVVQRTITLNSTLEIKTNIAIIGPSTSSGDPLKTAEGNHALKIERGSAVASGTPLIAVNPTNSPTPEPTPTPISSSTPEPILTPSSATEPQQNAVITEVAIKNVEIDSRVSIPTPGPSAPATVAGEGSVVKVNPSPSLNTSLNTTPESSQSESPPTPASETSTVTVKLEGVKVVNSLSDSGGAVINTPGNVEVTNSQLIGNQAGRSESFGNAVPETPLPPAEGGAIKAGGDVSIINSSLSGNKSTGSGGAVSAGGDVTISSSSTPSTPSTISSNVAQGDGGAVHAGGVVSITNSNLDNNTSGGSGGAVSTESPVLITNSGLGYNHAAGSGGAVNAGSTVEIINSTLDHNQANADGGAVSAAGAVLVSNSLLSDNTAANSGGAIRASSVEANLSTFFGNRASNGGALLVEEAVDIQSSSFEANWAVPAVDGDEWDFIETLAERVFGGDATPEDENGFLTTSIWNGGLGGAIFIGGIFDSVSNIFDTTFGFNRARVGGAIHGNLGGLNIATSDSNVDWGSQLLTDSDIAGTNCPWADSQPHMSTSTSQSTCFIQNHSLDSGGAIAHAGNLQIANSIFDGNTSGNVFVDSGDFVEEITSLNPGLVLEEGGLSTFQIYLANRSLFADGGAIHVDIQNYFPDENLELPQNSVHITNSLFEDNYAGGDGGAVVFQGLLYVLASRFKGNSVIFGNGGAIASNSIQVSASKFDQNFANCNGYSTWRLFESSDFTEFLQQNGCMGFFSEGPTLIYNDYNANNGGAIFTEEASILGSEFLGNEARGDGGAIFSFNVSVENSLFHEHNISNPWFDNEELIENEDYDPREYINNINYDPRETVPNSNYNGQETIDNPNFNQVAELLTPNRDENIQYCGARHHSMSFQDGNYTFCSESITYLDGINVAPSGRLFYTSQYMPNPAYDPRATIANPAYDPVQFLPNPDFDEREFLLNPEFDPVQFVENPDYDNREFLSLGNRAGRRGGAIAILSYSDESDQLTNTIVNTDFIGNKAGISGGAIDIFYDGDSDVYQTRLTIMDSVFELNASQFYGGAIGADGVVLLLESSAFKENSVSVEEYQYSENDTYGGGAIWIDGSSNVSASWFESNSVQLQGCALNVASEPGLNLDVSSCIFNLASDYEDLEEFFWNFSPLSGGAIKIQDGFHLHTFSNTNFYANTAFGNGGALDAGIGAEVEFRGTDPLEPNIFVLNVAGLNGGAISGESLMLRVENYSFGENRSLTSDGGAIAWSGIVEIKNSLFDSNVSYDDGGAVDIDSLDDDLLESNYFDDFLAAYNMHEVTDLTQIKLANLLKSTILDSAFTDNRAENGDGGAIEGTDYDLKVESSSPLLTRFVSNSAGDDGGAIWVVNGAVLEINGVSFARNEAGDEGGAIYTDTIQIKNSRFFDNYADNSGGAIKILNDSLRQKLSIVVSTEFFENEAFEGGAIAGSPWIISSTFINNRGGNGSAISMSGTVGTMLLSSFLASTETGVSLCGNQSADPNLYAFFNTKGTVAMDNSCFSYFPPGLTDIAIGSIGTNASEEVLIAIGQINSELDELQVVQIARAAAELLPKYEISEFFGDDNLYFALLEEVVLFNYYISNVFPNSLSTQMQNESGEWQTHNYAIDNMKDAISAIFGPDLLIPDGIVGSWDVFRLLEDNADQGDRWICFEMWNPEWCYWSYNDLLTPNEYLNAENLGYQIDQNYEGMLYLDYPSIFGDEFILNAVSQDILGRNRTRLTLGTPGAYEPQLEPSDNQNSGDNSGGSSGDNSGGSSGDSSGGSSGSSSDFEGNSSNGELISSRDEIQLQLLRQSTLENALKVQAELDRIAKELAELRAQELAAKAAAAAQAKAQRKAIRDAKRKFTADLAAKIAARKKATSEIITSISKPVRKTNPKKSLSNALVVA